MLFLGVVTAFLVLFVILCPLHSARAFDTTNSGKNFYLNMHAWGEGVERGDNHL